LPAKAASLALQFLHLVPLSTALRVTRSSCQRAHKRCPQTPPPGDEGLREPSMCANPHAECQECPRGGAQAAPALLSSSLL